MPTVVLLLATVKHIIQILSATPVLTSQSYDSL
jgi:hypothetical protein